MKAGRASTSLAVAETGRKRSVGHVYLTAHELPAWIRTPSASERGREGRLPALRAPMSVARLRTVIQAPALAGSGVTAAFRVPNALRSTKL